MPDLWPNDWILDHDNALISKTLFFELFLAKKSTTKTEHPKYYPDSALNGFWPFSKINSILKGLNLMIVKMPKNVMTARKAISRHWFQKYL
jgi:ribosomal protein S8